MEITKDIEITLTAAASMNLEKMQKRIYEIAGVYGERSAETHLVQLSFSQFLMQILRFGGKIYAEDDLSLIVVSYITLGVIWHPVRHKKDKEWITDPLLGEWSVHS